MHLRFSLELHVIISVEDTRVVTVGRNFYIFKM